MPIADYSMASYGNWRYSMPSNAVLWQLVLSNAMYGNWRLFNANQWQAAPFNVIQCHTMLIQRHIMLIQRYTMMFRLFDDASAAINAN